MKVDIENLPTLLAIKYSRKYNADYDDLKQEADLGVLMAQERFDKSKGIPFTAFACIWIKKCILKYLATKSRLIRLPEDVYFNIIVKKECKSGKTTKREAVSDAKAVMVEIDNGEGEANLLNFLKGEEDFSSKIETAIDNQREVKRRMSCLSPKQRKIIKLYFGLGCQRLSGANLAKKYGCSRQNIDERLGRAIKKMRREVEHESSLGKSCFEGRIGHYEGIG